VRTAELDYPLDEELIAKRPLQDRAAARLLVVGDGLEHRTVRDLPELLPAAALVVVNDTRVIAARLYGKKASGGRVEILLVRDLGGGRWRAMAKSSKPMRVGAEIAFEGLAARVVDKLDDGLVELAFEGAVEAALERIGHVPLPPYLGRDEEPADRERYQTAFARVPGAVAAPTAGLHFDEALIARLRARCAWAKVTLHVGPGTFRPVTADDLDAHAMHEEWFEVPAETAAAVAQARERGAPVVAIGTTVVRTLESAADAERPGHVRAQAGETRLLIQPGYRFQVVDALVTNFHLPRSTLLALVYAFGGAARVREAYLAATAARYRFFSYGDAMLLRGRP
jgi:S-adenosylmethionine:tRNA ribosyltransferase-isomerase